VCLFFFQAEDGIRDGHVTGVQTCALPIWALVMALHASSPAPHGGIWVIGLIGKPLVWLVAILAGTAVSAACVVVAKGLGRRSLRSEERRVGKEGRSWGACGRRVQTRGLVH